MITNETCNKLNKHINKEIWSAYLYLSMSLDASHKGYPGISNWFYIHAREKMEQSRIMQKYILAHGMPVMLEKIDEVPTEWPSLLSMLETRLHHEIATASSINEMIKELQHLQDYATLSQLIWFVDEQVTEEEDCANVLQQIKSTKDNPCLLFQIDRELQQYKFKRAQHNRAEQWFS